MFPLKRAVQEGSVVRIIYLARNGIISDRKVRVFYIEQNMMKGFCLNKSQYRTFKLTNILALVFMEGEDKHHESA